MSHVDREFNSDNTRGLTLREYCRLLFFGLSLLLLFDCKAYAQWKKVFDPDYAGTTWTYPTAISFNKWGIGFVANRLKDGYQVPYLWRSVDGGISWQQPTIGKPVYNTDVPIPYDFTFKDSLTGWFAGMGAIYETTDGGASWFDVYDAQGLITCSIFYNHQNGLLICGLSESWGVMISSDDGDTWSQPPGVNSYQQYNGFAFLNDTIGIVGQIMELNGPIGHLFRTSDGGNSWNPIGPHFESWQPLAVNGLFYAIEDIGPQVYRSSDGGLTWADVYDFDTIGHHNALTGCIKADSRGNLVVQTGVYGRGDGLYMSSDSGRSWMSICGPYSTLDTRFSIVDNKIFAMDYSDNPAVNDYSGVFTNGTIWMLDLNKPWGILLDSSLTLSAPNCDTVTQAFHISSTFPCYGSVTLDSVSVEGSSTFTTQSELYQQNGIGDSDSILVHYQSENPYDTAHLVFHFLENGIKHDSAITIYGIGGAKLDVALYLKSANITSQPGDTISIPVYLSGNATLGETSITLPFVLDTNVLRPIGFQTAIPGLTAASIMDSGGVETISLQVNGISLNGDTLIGTLRCIVYLTDTLATSVSLAGASLTSANSPCVALSLTANSVNIVITGCGTATLLQFMKSGQIPFGIQSITPNPASGVVEINFINPLSSSISYQVIDVLGTVRMEGEVTGDELALDVHSLANGLYYLRVWDEEAGVAVSGKFMVER